MSSFRQSLSVSSADAGSPLKGPLAQSTFTQGLPAYVGPVDEPETDCCLSMLPPALPAVALPSPARTQFNMKQSAIAAQDPDSPEAILRHLYGSQLIGRTPRAALLDALQLATSKIVTLMQSENSEDEEISWSLNLTVLADSIGHRRWSNDPKDAYQEVPK